MTEYLEFKLSGHKPKTLVYDVIAKRSQVKLGTIKWYFSWRQYCFFPEMNVDALKLMLARVIEAKDPERVLLTLIDNWARDNMLVFSAGCQADITSFCQTLNMQQRKGKVSFKNTPRDAVTVPIIFEKGGS